MASPSDLDSGSLVHNVRTQLRDGQIQGTFMYVKIHARGRVQTFQVLRDQGPGPPKKASQALPGSVACPRIAISVSEVVL